jgi:hypothetical protein
MNNQPAFPVGLEAFGEDKTGMTLRDYFAAKAMHAFVTAWIEKNTYPDSNLTVAKSAYNLADAMLAAREKA